MIWLDGLDLPMYQAIPVNFAQGYRERRYPSLETPESMHKIAWKTVAEALERIPGKYARYQYLLPGGQQLSAIIGAEAERLDVGAHSPFKRETASFVYHAVEGEGYTQIGEERINWTKSDTFCVPAWKGHQHFNSSDQRVFLFSFSDRPLLEKLGMFRREENVGGNRQVNGNGMS
jgi:gentisate 1,2-dioxygenase